MLSVEDDGPGVATTAAEEIFERGKRLDSQVPGTGLGLSIVKDIAEVYGIDVSCERAALGGLFVTLRFAPQNDY